MAKRSKDQILQHFHRLYDIADAYVDAWCLTLSKAEAEIVSQNFVSRKEMLNWVEKGVCTASQIERGVKSALSDFRDGYKDKLQYRPEEASLMTERYARLRGLPFLEDLERTLNAPLPMPLRHTDQETST